MTMIKNKNRIKAILCVLVCAAMLAVMSLPALAAYMPVADCTEGLTPGDANGDGEVGLKDVSRMIRYIAQWRLEINADNADVRNDGDLNLKDVSLLIRYLAGWTDVRLGHLDEKTEISAATCTEGGVVEIKCTLCGNTENLPTAPLGHDFVRGECSRCDAEAANRDFFRMCDWIAENGEADEEFSEAYYFDIGGYGDDETGFGRSQGMIYVCSDELGGDIISLADVMSTETEFYSAAYLIYSDFIVEDPAESLYYSEIMWLSAETGMNVSAEIIFDGYGNVLDVSGSMYEIDDIEGTELELSELYISGVCDIFSSSLADLLASLDIVCTAEGYSSAWFGFAQE